MICKHMKRFIRYYYDSPVYIDNLDADVSGHFLQCVTCGDGCEPEEWDKEVETLENRRRELGVRAI